MPSSAVEPSLLSDGSPVWLLLAPDDDAVTAVDGSGRGVARGAYRRVYGPRATLELEIDDAYWHRGLPELVLRWLGDHADRHGITTFLVSVGAADVRLLALLGQEFAARATRDGPRVEVEFATAARS